MTTLTVADATLPPLAFRLPEGIHAIEVSLDPEERAQAARRLVRDVYPQGEERLWTTMGSLYSAMADELLADGVAFFGIGLYAIEDGGGVAHCALTLAVHERGDADPDVVAEGTRAALLADPLREVSWLDLPCGPAVYGITFRKLLVDGAYTTSGADEELVMGQIQVHIPFPADPYTAVLTLDTASVAQWEEFSHAMAEIIGSVDFTGVHRREVTH
ncbi:hypothetical protein QFZ55_004866 [Streptomyces luteogriseus]|jgi:hypothetical protein|uniref:hypothetical protein n=1 Tax=Streptomyces luteogriseus TaxID=68233 RepID=UPI002782A150|nr:hypothetical protein [Streptomyces luteogriseus]MDQ0715414.1 hypothetical protein [Streptomyces luteogriseus]